jgi:FlaA1/EpsC-like NDP-sugar epimerase
VRHSPPAIGLTLAVSLNYKFMQLEQTTHPVLFASSGARDKTILITGAGGSIGSALAKTIAKSRPDRLILLENSEHSLYQIEMELAALPGGPICIPILGDICDVAFLDNLFEKYGPDIVYHAAALKHVSLMEKNPLAALRSNGIGTFNLAGASIRYDSATFVMISTDKAVNPHSVMGASKRLAELSMLHLSGSRTKMTVLRLGNVWGSTGSVVPLFLQQISRGGPVTVTHPDVSRYFLSLAETVDLILAVANLDGAEGIFVPEIGQPVKLVEVARQLIESAELNSKTEIPILFTALAPGEKLAEDLISSRETVEPSGAPRLRRIVLRETLPIDFEAQIKRLATAIERYDLRAAFEITCQLVPEYRPSDWLLKSLPQPQVQEKA